MGLQSAKSAEMQAATQRQGAMARPVFPTLMLRAGARRAKSRLPCAKPCAVLALYSFSAMGET